RIRIGQGRAPYAIRTQVVEPGRMALQPRYDLAQARSTRKLAVEQRHELTLGRQSAHPGIRSMRLDQSIEFRPRNMLQSGVKHAILMPHGADPRFESGNVW